MVVDEPKKISKIARIISRVLEGTDLGQYIGEYLPAIGFKKTRKLIRVKTRICGLR